MKKSSITIDGRTVEVSEFVGRGRNIEARLATGGVLTISLRNAYDADALRALAKGFEASLAEEEGNARYRK